MANNEFGDFQTPDGLVKEIFAVLSNRDWGRILEPTCGLGNFLREAHSAYPEAELRGVEMQENYAQVANNYAPVTVADAMTFDFAGGLGWTNTGPMLVVGNPPWVTNAALTTLGSLNKPKLDNIRALKGLDALTGASNFDIAEAIILRLIAALDSESPTIALLCKTQVARNVLAYAEQFELGVRAAQIYEIDALRWFNAGVDACLFVLELAPGATNYVADVYPSLSASSPRKRIGVVGGRLVSDVDKYQYTREADGVSPIMWRQGIKHDGTKAMELVESDGPHKKSGEPVDIESEHLFPLLKCTDVARSRTRSITKWMVVPQRHTGDDTRKLQLTAPKLWDYLEEHAEILDNRKSSIYRNRSRFCIFGVGEYSFSPYKVAISAMHKVPNFELVAPLGGRPVVFDDVCYFTSFESLEEAAFVAAVLRSKPASDFLESVTFTDSKRPITKKLLQRLDLGAIARLSQQSDLVAAGVELAETAGHPVDADSLTSAGELMLNRWASPTSADTLVVL